MSIHGQDIFQLEFFGGDCTTCCATFGLAVLHAVRDAHCLGGVLVEVQYESEVRGRWSSSVMYAYVRLTKELPIWLNVADWPYLPDRVS